MKNRIISCLLLLTVILTIIPTEIIYAEGEAPGEIPPTPDWVSQLQTDMEEMKCGFEEMANINNDPSESYVLMNDIDLSTYNGGEWEPINSFRGTLDGQGHKIKNLRVTGNRTYAGLFDIVNRAKIKNIGLVDTFIDISTAIYAGGIVGKEEYATTIENCYNTGSISATRYAGGIVGRGIYSFEYTSTANTLPLEAFSSGNGAHYHGGANA